MASQEEARASADVRRALAQHYAVAHSFDPINSKSTAGTDTERSPDHASGGLLISSSPVPAKRPVTKRPTKTANCPKTPRQSADEEGHQSLVENKPHGTKCGSVCGTAHPAQMDHRTKIRKNMETTDWADCGQNTHDNHRVRRVLPRTGRPRLVAQIHVATIQKRHGSDWNPNETGKPTTGRRLGHAHQHARIHGAAHLSILRSGTIPSKRSACNFRDRRQHVGAIMDDICGPNEATHRPPIGSTNAMSSHMLSLLLCHPERPRQGEGQRDGGRTFAFQNRPNVASRYRGHTVKAAQLSALPSPIRAAYNAAEDRFLGSSRGMVRDKNDRAMDSKARHFASWLAANGHDDISLSLTWKKAK